MSLRPFVVTTVLCWCWRDHPPDCTHLSNSGGPRRGKSDNHCCRRAARRARFRLRGDKLASGRRGSGEVSSRTAMIGSLFRVQRSRGGISRGHCHRNQEPIVRSPFCPSEKLVRELASDHTHHRPSPRLPMHEIFGRRSLCHVNIPDLGRRGATWR